MTSIVTVLKETRGAMKQEVLARRLNVGQSAVSKMEKGEWLLSPEMASRLAGVFEEPVERFLVDHNLGVVKRRIERGLSPRRAHDLAWEVLKIHLDCRTLDVATTKHAEVLDAYVRLTELARSAC